MESDNAILAFAALAQPTRLDVFRLLMEHEPDGLPAGEVARRLDVPHNTMSTHLATLTRASLIEAERHSRSIIYRARLDAVRALASFLVKDCCGGRPEICAPLLNALLRLIDLLDQPEDIPVLAPLIHKEILSRLPGVARIHSSFAIRTVLLSKAPTSRG